MPRPHKWHPLFAPPQPPGNSTTQILHRIASNDPPNQLAKPRIFYMQPPPNVTMVRLRGDGLGKKRDGLLTQPINAAEMWVEASGSLGKVTEGIVEGVDMEGPLLRALSGNLPADPSGPRSCHLQPSSEASACDGFEVGYQSRRKLSSKEDDHVDTPRFGVTPRYQYWRFLRLQWQKNSSWLLGAVYCSVSTSWHFYSLPSLPLTLSSQSPIRKKSR